MCAENSSSVWTINWVNRNCPATMRHDNCALKPEQKESCDTSCHAPIWNKEQCCPSEALCFTGNEVSACPYDQCRFQVLKEVRNTIRKTVLFLQAFLSFSGVMIILTCLLICYNPRDEIEIELLKTGVMTEDDIATIEKLKNDKIFSYNKGNGKIQGINLDSLHTSEKVSRRVVRNSKSKRKIYPNPQT